MALKGFMWAAITILALILAAVVVGVTLMVAAYLENHPNHAAMSDGLNYTLAAAVGYFLADPEDGNTERRGKHAGGNR